MRDAIGGFGLTIFAVVGALTPFAFYASWPTPFWFLLVDAVALAAWGQAVQGRSGLTWSRTFAWLGVFVLLIAALAVGFLAIRLGSQLLGQSVIAAVGYILVVVALLWAFGWVMGDSRRARAFLALRRAALGKGTPEDIAILNHGPRAYL